MHHGDRGAKKSDDDDNDHFVNSLQLLFAKDDVQSYVIEQHLDHFRPNDPRSFQQRYFYTDRYVRPKRDPSVSKKKENNYNEEGDDDEDDDDDDVVSYAFLCVGGEGPALDETVLTNSVHCTGDMLELAHRLFHERSNTNIHLFALEHRYYGESYPVFWDKMNSSSSSSTTHKKESPVTNENLVYLSSRQALADLAHFVSTTMNQQKKTTINMSPNTQWVTFGGSYPGMMAAWARLKFPHLISAAVSSSAPLQATLDFAAYNNHVARVLQMPAIGGSAKCHDIVAKGHEQLSYLLLSQSNKTDDPKTKIAQDFFLCNATAVFQDTANIAIFIGDGVIGVGAQENDPACSKKFCSIQKKCETLIHAVDELNLTESQGLQYLVQQQRMRKKNNNSHCADVNWKRDMEFIADPVRGQEGGTRSWLWQTCTEFGFYQTCETQSACPFGKGWHTLRQDLELCQKAFGVDPWQTAKAVQDTLEYYGGWNIIGASRILSVNGDVDPWSELAIQRSTNPNLPAYVVKGASHHFWTHPSRLTDGPEVAAARRFIHSTIIQWLDDDDYVNAIREG